MSRHSIPPSLQVPYPTLTDPATSESARQACSERRHQPWMDGPGFGVCPARPSPAQGTTVWSVSLNSCFTQKRQRMEDGIRVRPQKRRGQNKAFLLHRHRRPNTSWMQRHTPSAPWTTAWLSRPMSTSPIKPRPRPSPRPRALSQ